MTPARLSLLTYNTGLLRAPVRRLDPIPHVDARLAVIPAEILRLEADVVALQEVFQPRDCHAILARVRTRSPHVGHVPAPRVQFDAGLLTLSRHPLRARVERFRDGPWSERFLSNKGALVTEIDLPDGASVTVVNLHATAGGFFALPESPRAEAMRRGQMEQLVAIARGARGTVLLVGDFNASNLLVVLGGLRALGVPLADACAVVPGLTPVPGRVQRVHGRDLEVVVDYAHTPDALDKVLSALRPLAAARGGRLVCVFGCGGNRDSTKRPLMGGIAARGADRVVVTSDNPRGESPAAILALSLIHISEPTRPY